MIIDTVLYSYSDDFLLILEHLRRILLRLTVFRLSWIGLLCSGEGNSNSFLYSVNYSPPQITY